MDCPLWSWDWILCTDIPNWHALFIEIIIGIIIALTLFFWQWNIRTKRRKFAQEGFVRTLDFVKSLLHRGGDLQPSYYENKEKYQTEINQLHHLLSTEANSLRFLIGISADSMDQKIIQKIDTISSIIEKPMIEGDPEDDSDNFIAVDTFIDELFEGPLKEPYALYQDKMYLQKLEQEKFLKDLKAKK